jgi:signal transduction histidine kinase
VGVLLALTLVLAGIMAYQAWDAARSHERIAKATLEEHALSAAWQLTSAIRRHLEDVYLWRGLEVADKVGGATPERPFPSLPTFRKVLSEFGWAFGKARLDFIFRLDLKTGKLEVQGDEAVDPETTQWLKTFLKDQSSAGPFAAKQALAGIKVHGAEGEERMFAFAFYPDPGPMARMAFGFQTDLSPLKDIVAKVGETTPLLPPALTGGRETWEILSFSVHTPSGRAVYLSSPQYSPEIEASDTVGTLYGGFTGSVHINPKAAELLVIGGLPKSRLPTIVGLLILTSALIIVATFQLRREQELALLRTDFVSSVSHQLRTPLAQIRMFGETLLLGRVRNQEEERRSLEIIVKEAQRLTHQVDNVLHFSRAQRGEIALNLKDMSLAPLVSEVLESFCPLAEAQECRVESSLDESLRAVVDPGAVRQILLNLLENAVKYGPPDQIIDVRLRKGPSGTVQLLVEDEGEGIPEDQRSEIFSPYSRLERDRDSGVAGSGIGLAVVKELARRQGGSVRVEDSVSGGARFIVAFPRSTGPNAD